MNNTTPIKESPYSRIPEDIRNSLTDEQRQHIHAALGARSWKRHKIDIRCSLSVPMSNSRFYLVFLFGKNRRTLSRTEEKVANWVLAVFISLFFTVSILLGLLTLYLLKSFLGIDLFNNFSLGIWDWFKS